MPSPANHGKHPSRPVPFSEHNVDVLSSARNPYFTKSNALKPEERLLIACASLWPNRRERIAALLEGTLEWARVLEGAREQGVLAMCYPVLQGEGRAAVPADVMAQCRAEAMATAERNLRLAAKVMEIVSRAEAAGIALVPYKGPVLAEMAYGNLGLRDFVDLDFIVPHRDLHAVCNLLKGLGYRLVNPSLTAPGAPVPGEYVFLSAASDVQVEVHTERTLRHFPFPPDLDPLIAARKAVTVAGRPVMTFSREDTLTLLAVHGGKDFWGQLLWIADIAWLVQTPNFDWDRALACANRMGCRRMTNVALRLAGETLGPRLPKSVEEAVLADPGACRQADWLARRLFAPRPLGRWEQARYRMRMVEGFWPGLRYVARLGTTPAADDWNAVRLPGPLRFAYSLLRPLRLLRRGNR